MVAKIVCTLVIERWIFDERVKCVPNDILFSSRNYLGILQGTLPLSNFIHVSSRSPSTDFSTCGVVWDKIHSGVHYWPGCKSSNMLLCLCFLYVYVCLKIMNNVQYTECGIFPIM